MYRLKKDKMNLNVMKGSELGEVLNFSSRFPVCNSSWPFASFATYIFTFTLKDIIVKLDLSLLHSKLNNAM